MTVVDTRTLDQAISRIREAIGDKACITDAAEIAPYVLDERGRYAGKSAIVARPATSDEVATVVSICADLGVPIVPQGGNTSMVGGSVPDGSGDAIVLSLTRLDTIRETDPANYTMTVEAGCILADIQNAASDADRLFPLSLGSEGTCRIGGNISTNAGGVGVLQYGMTRDLVLGLEVVLPDGRIWNGLRGLRKDNTGYDLKQLFVGGEGTLGIITAAVLKLYPKPRDVRTALVAVSGLDAALELLALAREISGDRVTAFELMSRRILDFVIRHIPGTKDPLSKSYEHYVLIELTSPDAEAKLGEALDRLLERAYDTGLVIDGTIAASEAQAQALWKLRESASEAQKHEGGSIKHDVSVPVSRVPEFIRRGGALLAKELPGSRLIAFGHVGDGNIHFNVSQPVDGDRDTFLGQWERINRIVHDLVAEMGGSFSAEHGVGQMKRGDLAHYRAPVELDLMRRIKAAIDPQNILNPGKVL